ncbi:MAG: nucleotidyltransferase domain-containing protein [Polyangiaceae bacterium]|nr:nucleotidyltransferase domain-containing protein [Polyangiaceae bacterium]
MAQLDTALRSALEAHEEVVLGYVFGSVARGEAAPTSDVDVALLNREPLGVRGAALLAEELARAIAYERRVDVLDLRDAPPALAAEVVREGVLLVERDPEARFDFETSAIRRFEDTRYLRRVQHELLREAARGRA